MNSCVLPTFRMVFPACKNEGRHSLAKILTTPGPRRLTVAFQSLSATESQHTRRSQWRSIMVSTAEMVLLLHHSFIGRTQAVHSCSRRLPVPRREPKNTLRVSRCVCALFPGGLFQYSGPSAVACQAPEIVVRPSVPLHCSSSLGSQES